jgi:sugar phosphate isomerase/epimerase
MSLKFGLELYSVRQSLQQDAVGTINKVAEIGYKHLQPALPFTTGPQTVAGTLDASELRKLTDSLGLDMPSIHARVDENTDLDRLIAVNAELGSSAIIHPAAFFTDREDVLARARAWNRYGERCRQAGVQFYYHNHFHEFQVMGAQTVMDLLLENTDPDLVKIELDTYWAARGGVDPVAWLRKLGSRGDLAHQKDIPATAQPVNLFERFGTEGPFTVQNLIAAQSPADFAEVGEGTMDLRTLFDAMREVGVKWVFVEQDITALDEIESVRISYRNISKLVEQ